MSVIFRATGDFLAEVRADLRCLHPFAAERVGFIAVRAAHGHERLVLLAETYHSIADADYVDDPSVGAMMSQEAIRKSLDIALLNPVGMFHVHIHGHYGSPRFSRTDLREQLKFVPDFFKVRRQMPHGAIVLSRDRAMGRVWLRPEAIIDIVEFNFVGPRMTIEAPLETGGNGRTP